MAVAAANAARTESGLQAGSSTHFRGRPLGRFVPDVPAGLSPTTLRHRGRPPGTGELLAGVVGRPDERPGLHVREPELIHPEARVGGELAGRHPPVDGKVVPRRLEVL